MQEAVSCQVNVVELVRRIRGVTVRTTPRFRSSTVAFLVGLACATQGAARAADSPADATPAADTSASGSGVLEEITVTARRRSESLLQVPVAINVVTASQLRNNDATDLTKIGELAPQVIIGTASTGTGALLTIRGISSSPLDAGIDQSVSVDIDGVQVSRGRIITASFFDVQQVQIMKGPQALFFGKNSPAGVISVESVNPTSALDGYIRTGYEFNADERFGEGAISGPLTDTLKARFAFRVSYMDGWIRNVATPQPDPLDLAVTMPGGNGTTPNTHSYTGRLSLQWTPADDFDAMLKVTFDDQKQNSASGYGVSYCENGVTVPTTLTIPDTQGTCALGMTRAISNLPPQFAVNYPFANNGVPYEDSTNTLASLVLNKRLQELTLTSTTGYYQQAISDADGYDWSSFTQVYDAEHEHYDLITQELRATTDLSIPVNFTGGFYYEHFIRPHFNAPFLLYTGINPATGNTTNNEQQADNSGDTFSAFTQARWNIIPTLELAGGARWTAERKDLTMGNIAVNPTGILPGLRPAGDFLNGHYSDHNVSPEATLTWHPTSDQTLYGAWKTGYKSGGFSNTSVLYEFYTADSLRFKHEISKGFEVGYKAELLEHSLRLDLTGYRYNYDGLQVTAFDAATISYNIRNAANARTEGFEGNVEWLATNALTFTASAGYDRARFLSFPGAQCYAAQTTATGCIDGVQDLSGKQLVRAPEVVFDAGARYQLRLPGTWNAELSLDGDHTSAYPTAETEDPFQMQPSFWRLNAAVHVHPNDRLDFAVIGRDLTNSFYAISTSDRTLGGLYNYAGWFARPREVIAQVEYHF
jgi:iron complex outermembrane receptor protein